MKIKSEGEQMKRRAMGVLSTFGVVSFLPVAAWAAGLIEESPYFEKWTDRESGVVSYRLKPGLVSENQQHQYFVSKSISDDCRFLFITRSRNERHQSVTQRTDKVVFDLVTGKVVATIKTRNSCFFDVAANRIYGFDDDGFFCHDLNADPARRIALCPTPDILKLQSCKAGPTHLTLAKDRKRAFADMRLYGPGDTVVSKQGTVNLETGAFEPWGETDFLCNHGQLCPADDKLAMCAWEQCWEEEGQAYERRTGWYPRLWLLRADGTKTFVPSKLWNRAAHEKWTENGEGFYWCARPAGVMYCDLGTGEQSCVCPHDAEHATMTRDLKYVTFDQKPFGWWRGSAQRVGFYNRATGRKVWVYSTSPAIGSEKVQSNLHPDAHPCFTANDRYIVSTLQNGDGHLDFLVTPVAQLIAMTSDDAGRIAEFENWPAEANPNTVGHRLVWRFLDHLPQYWTAQHAPHLAEKQITYPTVCAWFGALDFAAAVHCIYDRKWFALMNAQYLYDPRQDIMRPLCDRYEPFYCELARLVPKADHVDNTVFGCIPLKIFPCSGNERARQTGLAMADEQWREPREADEQINGMADHAGRVDLWKRGYSWQTRLWMDDMFMITAVQLEAYKVSGERKYADRAAKEMVLYLDKLQNADGLFYHAPDVPFVWGRGDGWMAAGMAMSLKGLPEDQPERPRILAGYRKMMAALLKHQRTDGLWGQLVDDPGSWAETSGSAMFCYAFVEGVKHGWLDRATYAPAARKAFIALCGYLDENCDLREVCCGTNKKNDRQYYLDRPRIVGDLHGQAPMLWCCAALAEEEPFVKLER